MIVTVNDPGDPRLDVFRWRERQLATIAQRRSFDDLGSFIAEGDLVVERALAAGYAPDVVLCEPKHAARFDEVVTKAGGTVIAAPADVRREVTGLGVPLDAIGVFRRAQLPDVSTLIDTSARIVIVDCVDNPSNVGSIARTAAALGWNAMLLDRTSADPLARRALRVSMGTTFLLPFTRVNDVPHQLGVLRAAGFAVIGLTPRDPARSVVSLAEVQMPVDTKRALVLGSERQGLSEETLDACSHLASIDMAPGVDSLNVATAAAIACWALA
jgi:tRNA G18 (ribose-2'-O)-methylase SpoU